MEHQRVQADGERVQHLALVDAMDEPILVVDASGDVVKANRPFVELVGDPAAIALLGDGEKPVDGRRDPRRRAAASEFEEELSVNGRRYRVVGRPLEAVDGGYGALIFRPIPD